MQRRTSECARRRTKRTSFGPLTPWISCRYQKPSAKKNKYQKPGGKKNKYQKPGAKKNKYQRKSAQEDDGYSFDDPNANHMAMGIKFDEQKEVEKSLQAFGAAVKFQGG